MKKLKALWPRAKVQLAGVLGRTEEWLIGIGPLPTFWYWTGGVLAVAVLALAILLVSSAFGRKEQSVAETAVQAPAADCPEPVAAVLPAPSAAQAPRVVKAKSYRSPVSQTQSDDATLPPEPEEIVWQAPPAPVTRESVDQYRATLR